MYNSCVTKVSPIFLAIVIGMWLPAAFLFSSLLGCAPGTTGLIRPMSDQAYSTATNVISTVAVTAAPIIPAPFNAAANSVAAAALALLAAWQAVTQKKLDKLAAQRGDGTKEPTK